MSDALNRETLAYLRSINTPDYPVESWVINPDLSAVEGVPPRYWKLTGDAVSEMSQAEKDVVDAAIKVTAEKNYLVAEYNSRGNVTKETWYGTDDGDGVYSDPVEESVYVYGGAGNKLLLSKTITQLYTDGTAASAPEVWEYVTDGDKKILKKVL